MEDKVSKYNIETEYKDGVLLYNSLSNNVLPASYKDYAVLETLLEHLPKFKDLYPDLYITMKNLGFIVSSDFDELAYIKLQNKRRIFTHNDYRITINPTLDCNLKCWYCSVDYAGTQHDKGRMSDGMIIGLCKHIENLITKHKANSIVLDWFGGEPMMYYDEVIRKISVFAKEVTTKNNVAFWQQMTTNATMLNRERILEMKDGNFNGFQITIDGDERKHNKVKFYSDKRGTFKDIVENINLIAEIMPNALITMRINYDAKTLKNIQEIINNFSREAKKNITVSFQKIWQVQLTDDLRRQLRFAKEEFHSAGFKIRFWAYQPFKFVCCYADNYRYYVINYNGLIFKCTARDYGENLAIGSLQDSGEIIWNDNLLSKYYERAAFENEKCENCNILPLCMGPCIQKKYEVKRNGGSMPCLYDNIEYPLSSHIIDLVKQQNLI